MVAKVKTNSEKLTHDETNDISSIRSFGPILVRRFLRKRLTLSAAALIIIVGLTGIFVNSYALKHTRTLFEEYVSSNFGYDAVVRGDISIQFQDKFLITLSDVRIKPPNSNQELFSAKSISAAVIPTTIFNAPLNIVEIAFDQPHLNYFILDGNDVVSPTKAEADLPFTEYNIFNPFRIVDNDELRIQKISIKDGSLDWKNIQKNSQRELRHLNLLIEKTSESNQEIFFQGSSTVRTFSDLIKDTIEWPLTVSTEIHKNSDRSTLELRNVEIGITPLLLSGGVNFSSEKYDGALRSNKFELSSLTETLQLMRQKNPMQIGADNTNNWSVESSFSGNNTGGLVTKNVITIGEELIEADIDWLIPDSEKTPTLRYEVRGGEINLAPILRNSVSNIKSTNTSNLSASVFKNFNSVGKVSLESITAQNFEAENLNFSANLERGVFDLELTPLSVFGGTLSGFLRLDSNETPPHVQSAVKGRRIKVPQLTPAISTRYGLSGDLAFEASIDAAAQDETFTLRSILDTVGGNITFALTNSTTNISLLSQTFSAIAALNPITDGFELWANEQQFSQVGGFVILEDGISDTHRLNLRLDNVDIDAVGKLNFETKSFNYLVEAMLLPEPEKQTLRIGDSYKNLGWPIVCQSRWQVKTDQYCRPDFTKVRDIFANFSSENSPAKNQDGSAEEERMRALLETLFN